VTGCSERGGLGRRVLFVGRTTKLGSLIEQADHYFGTPQEQSKHARIMPLAGGKAELGI
jgi:hypothetical protein